MMEYLEAIAGIKEGLADVNAGRTLSLVDFQQAMQEKQGESQFGQGSPHPPTPSPKMGEGEPDSKSLSHFGRGI